MVDGYPKWTDWISDKKAGPDAELAHLYGSDTVLRADREEWPKNLWAVAAESILKPESAEQFADSFTALIESEIDTVRNILAGYAGRVLRAILFQNALPFYPQTHWDESYAKDVQFNATGTNLATLLVAFEEDLPAEFLDETVSGNCSIEVGVPYLHLEDFPDPWEYWQQKGFDAQEEYQFSIPVCVYLCRYDFQHTEQYYPECNYLWGRQGYAIAIASMRYYPLLLKGARAMLWSGLYNYLISLAFSLQLPFDGLPSTYDPPHWTGQFPEEEVWLTSVMEEGGGTTVAQWGACATCKPYPHVDCSNLLYDAPWTVPLAGATAGMKLTVQGNLANGILKSLLAFAKTGAAETNFYDELDKVLTESESKCPKGTKPFYGPTIAKPGIWFYGPGKMGGPSYKDGFFEQQLNELNEEKLLQGEGDLWEGWIMVKFYVQGDKKANGERKPPKYNKNHKIVFRGAGTTQCCKTLNLLMDWTAQTGATGWAMKVNYSGTPTPLGDLYYYWFKEHMIKSTEKCDPDAGAEPSANAWNCGSTSIAKDFASLGWSNETVAGKAFKVLKHIVESNDCQVIGEYTHISIARHSSSSGACPTGGTTDNPSILPVTLWHGNGGYSGAGQLCVFGATQTAAACEECCSAYLLLVGYLNANWIGSDMTDWIKEEEKYIPPLP